MHGGGEVRPGDGGAGSSVGGEKAVERPGELGVEREQLQRLQREPAGLERRPLSAGPEREQVERQLEVGDQQLGPRAVAALAALVVDDTRCRPLRGRSRSSVPRKYTGRSPGSAAGSSRSGPKRLLGSDRAETRKRVEPPRAEEPFQRPPRAGLGEGPQPGMTRRRVAGVLARRRLDRGGDQVLRAASAGSACGELRARAAASPAAPAPREGTGPRPGHPAPRPPSSGGSSPSTFRDSPWNGQLASAVRLVDDSGPSGEPPRRASTAASTSAGPSRPLCAPGGSRPAPTRRRSASIPASARASSSHARLAQRSSAAAATGSGGSLRRSGATDASSARRRRAQRGSRRLREERASPRDERSRSARAGHREQPLHDVGRSAARAPAPPDDDPARRRPAPVRAASGRSPRRAARASPAPTSEGRPPDRAPRGSPGAPRRRAATAPAAGGSSPRRARRCRGSRALRCPSDSSGSTSTPPGTPPAVDTGGRPRRPASQRANAARSISGPRVRAAFHPARLSRTSSRHTSTAAASRAVARRASGRPRAARARARSRSRRRPAPRARPRAGRADGPGGGCARPRRGARRPRRGARSAALRLRGRLPRARLRPANAPRAGPGSRSRPPRHRARRRAPRRGGGAGADPRGGRRRSAGSSRCRRSQATSSAGAPRAASPARRSPPARRRCSPAGRERDGRRGCRRPPAPAPAPAASSAAEDGECAALERGSGLDGPAQRVTSAAASRRAPGATTASSASVGTLPWSGDGEPAHGLGRARPRQARGAAPPRAGPARPRTPAAAARARRRWPASPVSGTRRASVRPAAEAARASAARKPTTPGGNGGVAVSSSWATASDSGQPAGERALAATQRDDGELDPGRGHTLGGTSTSRARWASRGPGGADPLRGLGQGRGRDAAEGELVEQRLEAAEERRGPGLRAERAGPDRVHRGGEETVERRAAAGPEPGRRHDRVAQPLEGPALFLAEPLHGGPVTLRPAHDTCRRAAGCPASERGSARSGRATVADVPDAPKGDSIELSAPVDAPVRSCSAARGRGLRDRVGCGQGLRVGHDRPATGALAEVASASAARWRTTPSVSRGTASGSRTGLGTEHSRAPRPPPRERRSGGAPGSDGRAGEPAARRRRAGPRPARRAPGHARWAAPGRPAPWPRAPGRRPGPSARHSATVTARYAPSRPSTRAPSRGRPVRRALPARQSSTDHEGDARPSARSQRTHQRIHPHDLPLLRREIPARQVA